MMKILVAIAFYLCSISLFAQAPAKGLISPFAFKVSDDGVSSLKLLEAYRDYVYYDNNMNLIFGYGHLVLDVELEDLKTKFGYETILESGEKKIIPPTQKLSEAEKSKFIEDYLRKDIEYVVNNMKTYIKVPMKQNQVDAIIIYLYWRGSNAQNSEVAEFYELVNKKDAKAIMNFMITRHRADKPIEHYLPGLVRRNTNTANLYETGIYNFN